MVTTLTVTRAQAKSNAHGVRLKISVSQRLKVSRRSVAGWSLNLHALPTTFLVLCQNKKFKCITNFVLFRKCRCWEFGCSRRPNFRWWCIEHYGYYFYLSVLLLVSNFPLLHVGNGLTEDGEKVNFNIVLNSTTFAVASAGNVDIASGNKSTFNGAGGNVSIAAGSGLSKQGGSGGEITLKSGDGVGDDRFGGILLS